MLNSVKRILTTKSIALLMLISLPWLAFTASFQINENNPLSQGQAMAGSGSDLGDVAAIFNNPAILASIKQNQVYVGGSYIAPHISLQNAQATNTFCFTSAGPCVTTPMTGATSAANVANSAFVPNAYAAYKINDRFTAGLAITAPWGLTTDYGSNSMVRYMAQETSLETVNIAPELGIELNSMWSVGVGAQIQYANAEFSEFDGSAAAPSNYATDLKGNAWSYGYNAGVLFSPTTTTHFGLSYRSQINYNLKNVGVQYVQAGPIQPSPFGPDPVFPFNSNTSVAASMNTPAVWNLSATQQLNQHWQVGTTAQLTQWHSLQTINISMPDAYIKSFSIPLNWSDSWLYSVGTQYTLNQHWQFRTGAAIDQTPTNDTNRDARIPDTTRYWGALGASYHVNDRLSVDTAYEHIFMNNQHINAYKNAGTPGTPQETDNVIADYAGSANIFALGVNWKF